MDASNFFSRRANFIYPSLPKIQEYDMNSVVINIVSTMLLARNFVRWISGEILENKMIDKVSTFVC